MAVPPACLVARIAVAGLCTLGVAAAARAEPADPLIIPDTQLEPVSWTALDGWAVDDHVASFSAFVKSCAPFLAGKEPREGRPIQAALWHVCRRAAPLRPTSAAEAQAFFE
jgi:membrane-bound lytic murein transglycosylase A